MKSAEIKWIEPVAPGKKIKLRLMKRNKNDYAILEGHSFEEDHTFSRIKKINYKQIADIWRGEEKVLQEFYRECEEQDEKSHRPFVLSVKL